MAFWKRRKRPNKQIGITPPAAAPDRSGLAIIAIMKNEAEYIAEWVQFHRLAGVDHFFIYDNGSTDGSADVFRNATLPGELTLIPWSMSLHDSEGRQPVLLQVLAYAHAISNFGGRFRWMAAMDLDEFLFPVSADSLTDALDELAGVSNISLPWVNFGRCGHERKPAGGVVQNFTQRPRDPLTAVNFKCIFDPCDVNVVSVHYFETVTYLDLTSNDIGVLVQNKDRKNMSFISHKNIQMNHYYTKSTDEVSNKVMRGAISDRSSGKYEWFVNNVMRIIENDTIGDFSAVSFLKKHGNLSDKHNYIS